MTSRSHFGDRGVVFGIHRSRLVDVLAMLGAIVERGWSRSALARCTTVADDVAVIGRPYIENFGRIDLGRRLHLRSLPVQSHLVTSPFGHIEIGDDVVIGHGASISAHAHVKIGTGSRIAPFVMILDSDFHAPNERGKPPAPKAIRIGRDVRIGSRVTILRGTVIGDGAEIAANSVVSRAIPPFARAGGVPARLLPKE
ncbi:MAG: hypothetical protein NVS3B20_23290 [Polyangiales bacterium]